MRVRSIDVRKKAIRGTGTDGAAVPTAMLGRHRINIDTVSGPDIVAMRILRHTAFTGATGRRWMQP